MFAVVSQHTVVFDGISSMLCFRYFDKGLHKWLVRYVFLPLGGGNRNQGVLRNLVISALVFGFVYVWHGQQNDHLVWAGLNWFGVSIEKLADDIYRKPAVKEFEVSSVAHLRMMNDFPPCFAGTD